jgi:hypothetical protein
MVFVMMKAKIPVERQKIPASSSGSELVATTVTYTSERFLGSFGERARSQDL